MKNFSKLWVSLILIFVLASCSTGEANTTAQQNEVQTNAVQASDTTSIEVNEANTESVSATTVSVEHSETHDDAADYVWDESSVIPITLNGDSASVDSQDVTVEKSKVTITAAGTYSLSGSLTDGQIIVDTDDEEVVRLILNSVELHNSTSAAIAINNAKKVVLVLADNTENTISDQDSYVFEDADTDEPNAAIFSKADLTISGNGSLTVTGNYNDGISSKDGLIIASGTIRVNAVDDGIRGKDYLVIKDGNITVNALGDGLKSDNADDTSKGYITIDQGSISITANGDAIQAETEVTITNGDFTIASGGGSDGFIDAESSAKGIKGVVRVTIEGGNFTINSADDAVHSNDSIIIHGGTFNIATGDDGMHADTALTINNGNILISESYEGLESTVITINDGNIDVTSSDDGINVSAGNDGSGMMNFGGGGGRQRPDGGTAPDGGQPAGGPGGGGPGGGGGAPSDGAAMDGGFGQDAFTSTGSNYLYIHGGHIVVNASGDGLDVNGAIEMTDGVVLINGPTEQMNGALDYNSVFNISGGLLIAAGSSGMAQAPGTGSSQYSVLAFFDTTLQGGTMVSLQSDSGEEIFTFVPEKDYQSIAFSSPKLTTGTTYNLYVGGSSSGTESGGLYQDGTYTPGTLYQSFTISDTVTQIGSGGRRR